MSYIDNEHEKQKDLSIDEAFDILKESVLMMLSRIINSDFKNN